MRTRQPTGILGKALLLGVTAAVYTALGAAVVNKAAEHYPDLPLHDRAAFQDISTLPGLSYPGLPDAPDIRGFLDCIESIEHDAPDTITALPFSLEGRLQRTERYARLIQDEERRYGIPQHQLFALIMRESGGDHLMLNLGDDGGSGLGSMMPGIAVHYGMKTYRGAGFTSADTAYGKALRNLVAHHQDPSTLAQIHEPFDPAKSISAMAQYLADLHQYFSAKGYADPWEASLAAYNCGPQRVAAYIRGDTTLPTITRHHLAKVEEYRQAILQQAD
ncbi:MAG TPA: lytic transglycosylase domain-containing protein [Candidatus Nanoarchaeia archaeon]|nr:lytic transglycosylase domain-containing protein [Candidatus Nanoarchaeia archaeon]